MILGVDVAHWAWPFGWSWQNGVLPNLIASALWAGPAFFFGYVKGWRKHVRPHIERTRRIHDRLYPEEP